jgi:hypothetical protein
MKFAFIDECYFSIQNKPYTAAVASLWEANTLPCFRSDFIDAIRTAINPDPRQINAFPTIHAAEMTKEYDDNIKLLCFETIARLSQQFGVDFYYLGYFHHIPLLTSEIDLLMLSINQLCDLLTSTVSDELVFVYELNLGKHKVISQNYNDWHTHYYRAMVGEENLSIKNLGNILGRYYCDKLNYHMAITDTASYVRNLRMKADSGEKITDFKSQILLNTSTMHTRFVFDEIIQLNVWPYDKRTGSGPARYCHNITPSDEKTVPEQFGEFLEELRVYWTGYPSRLPLN